jgi:hypothetical protein
MPNFPEFISKLAAAVEAVFSVSEETLDFDAQAANVILAGPVAAPAADPTFRTMVLADLISHVHPTKGASAINRLAGITPTQTGWDTTPTSLANATDLDWATTTGIAVQTTVNAWSTTAGYIMLDMGAIYTILIGGKFTIGNTNAGGGNCGLEIKVSTDNITYYDVPQALNRYSANFDVVYEFTALMINARYIRLYAHNDSGTQTGLRLGVHEIEAWDLGLA